MGVLYFFWQPHHGIIPYFPVLFFFLPHSHFGGDPEVEVTAVAGLGPQANPGKFPVRPFVPGSGSRSTLSALLREGGERQRSPTTAPPRLIIHQTQVSETLGGARHMHFKLSPVILMHTQTEKHYTDQCLASCSVLMNQQGPCSVAGPDSEALKPQKLLWQQVPWWC